ncbi:MAG TPA: hypothetical protein VFE84_03515 [Patescibacteria group bacterium]|jgi:hypothetical protein|nr:hypothetical protein [Patescibacteria group bacterium]
MKRIAAIASLLALVVVGTMVYAADASGSSTWTGWITDEQCGAKNANADGKACALKCAKNGAKLVLFVDGDKKLVALDNQDEAMKHVGVPVTVTGTLDGGTIKVQKIEDKKS